jgi:hypothetical protein
MDCECVSHGCYFCFEELCELSLLFWALEMYYFLLLFSKMDVKEFRYHIRIVIFWFSKLLWN